MRCGISMENLVQFIPCRPRLMVSLPRVRRAEQSEARRGILRGPLIGHKLVNNFIRLTAGSAKNDIANTEKHEATILPIHV